MDIGLIFAILAAAAFAAGTVSVRRGLFHSETPLGGVFISVPIGTLFFLGLLTVTGQYKILWHVPWHAFAILGIAGVTSCVAGRILNYTSVQHLGANRNTTIMRTSPLYAVIFGVVLLNESLTVVMILGILLVVLGATLVSVTQEKETRALRTKGIITGLGAALLYAIAAALVKSVIREVGSPLGGVFIAFTTASALLAILFSRRQFRHQLLELERRSVIAFIIAGVMTATAQLFRYAALGHSPLSLVEPVLMSANAFFVLAFSFLINRNIDLFNLRVIVGIIITLVGALLLFL